MVRWPAADAPPGSIKLPDSRSGGLLGLSEGDRHPCFDDGSGIRRRAHLYVAAKLDCALAHAEQTEVLCGEVVELLDCEAASVVGHGDPQLVGAELDGHLQPDCLCVAECVAHGLLDKAKGRQLDFGGEANFLAGDLQFGVQVGFLLDLEEEAGEGGDQAEAVEDWWS